MLPRFNTLFSARILILAAGLFAVGVATLVYNITKAQPPPREWFPAVSLQAPTTSATPTPYDTPIPPRFSQTRTIGEQPRLITPPEISITNPRAGAAFDAPADIIYEASILSNHHRISKVEFFLAKTSNFGTSLCNDNRDMQIPQPALVKRGEITQAPYLFHDSEVKEGTYAVYAVVHTAQGVRQISKGLPISVNKSFAQRQDEISGWRVWGSDSRGVYALPPNFEARRYADVADSEVPCFEVKVSSDVDSAKEGAEITFEAQLTKNEPPKNLTYQWKLSDGRVVSGEGSNKIVVNTAGLGGTIVVAEVRVEKPGTSCFGMATAEVGIIQPHSANRYNFRNLHERLSNFAWQLKQEPTATALIILDKKTTGCTAKGYLIQQGIEAHRIRIFVKTAETEFLQLWIVPEGASLPEEAESVETYEFRDCTREQLSNRSYLDDLMKIEPPHHPYTDCPDLAERIHFMTRMSEIPPALNICLHNDRDPQNDPQQISIRMTPSGIFGGELKYKYLIDGGVITGEGQQAVWDLSPVKTKPGFYSITVDAGDDCACESLTAGRVLVTNFCTPCFHVACFTTKEQSADNKIALQATVPEWVTKQPNRFDWTASQGTIVQGQGTPVAIIDTTGIPPDTAITAKVKVIGLPTYCVDEVSYVATVGADCLSPRKFDEYGNIRFGDKVRAAKRNQGTVIVSTEEQPSHPTGSPSPAALKEREYVRILWPNPVETQRSFNVIVKYDRTTQSLQLTDTASNVTEALTTDLETLIKDKWGDRYEVWASMKLQSVALGCPQWCKDDFKPLASKQQQWSFNLTSSQPGNFSFNLEMWVEGRAIDQIRGKDAVPVWGKENLPITVREVIPTKNQVYAVGALLCFVSIGFFFRGVKFGNIRIIFAGGDIVGRDKVGGDKIGGDKIGRDKSQHWENPNGPDDG